MNTSIKICLAVASLALASVSPHMLAQSTGGVQIEGDVEINATAGDVSTKAEGDSTASSAVGSVRGDTNISGDVRITANADTVTTQASGTSCAETAIGVVGTGLCK